MNTDVEPAPKSQKGRIDTVPGVPGVRIAVGNAHPQLRPEQAIRADSSGIRFASVILASGLVNKGKPGCYPGQFQHTG